MTRPTIDALKLDADGHLFAGRRVEVRRFPHRVERDHRGHTFVQLLENDPGEIEYVPRGCRCGDCAGRRRG